MTNKRKGKSRKTLRRKNKQKGGENPSDLSPVDMSSDLSKVMKSLPSRKIFPLHSEIDNKLLEAFEKSGIDIAWRTLVKTKESSKPLASIIRHMTIDFGEEEADLPDPAMLYLLLITRAWMIFFVKTNGGYKSARELFIEQNFDDSPDGEQYTKLNSVVEHFLHTLSDPKKPHEYNKLMKHMWDNPHLILSVASYVFGVKMVEQSLFSNEEEGETVSRTLQFDDNIGGRKQRKSRKRNRSRKNKGKNIRKKTISKRRSRKSIRK